MRRIVWSQSALDDFDEAIGTIARDDSRAARSVADRIDAAIQSLAATPTGRRGRVPGTYEKVVHGLPYIVAYALRTHPSGDDRLIVLRVIHGARDWPEGRWP
ncbi:MAG: type II toxin-antitoxin system RelE/ParE family toxin [Alphaproteobacteria bacterium]